MSREQAMRYVSFIVDDADSGRSVKDDAIGVMPSARLVARMFA